MSVLPDKETFNCLAQCEPFADSVSPILTAFDRIGAAPTSACMILDFQRASSISPLLACHTVVPAMGRSIAIAAGMKRAKPSLAVIVVIDERSTAACLNDLVQTAQDGVAITVFLIEPSPSRTSVAKTKLLRLDLCQSLASVGAECVTRQRHGQDSTLDSIGVAIRYPGFAFMELRYGEEARKATSCQAQGCDGAKPYQRGNSAQSIPAEPRGWLAQATLPDRLTVWMAGLDAKDQQDAIRSLAGSAIKAGFHACVIEGDRSSSACQATSLILSPKPINYVGRDDPDIVIISSSCGAIAIGDISNLRRDAVVWVDEDFSASKSKTVASVRQVDFKRIMAEQGRTTLGPAILDHAIRTFLSERQDPT